MADRNGRATRHVRPIERNASFRGRARCRTQEVSDGGGSTAPNECRNAPNASLRGQAARSLDADDGLVDRIRQGDREAFDRLYDRYFKRVYAFLDKRLRNRADTEETTQEVFINVYSSIDSYRGDAPFAAWIFGLTRRTLASRFKRKRHPMVPLADEDEERLGGSLSTSTSPTETPDPLAHYEMSERAEQLLHALEHELSPSQRRVFEMHHLQSVSIAEIARTLSKSEDSIKSSLYRSRKLLLAR